MGQNSSTPAQNTRPHDERFSEYASNLHLPTVPALADSASAQIRVNFEALQRQLNDRDLISLTLTYPQFLSYITQLNEICRLYPDEGGKTLVFAVKKGTDSTFLWKATVRVWCLQYHPLSSVQLEEAHKLLNFRQFLQMFRRISFECSGGLVGLPCSSEAITAPRVPPTHAAATVLHEMDRNTGDDSSREASAALEECVICLERRADTVLPCTHAYCTPCIVQWWEYAAVLERGAHCSAQEYMHGPAADKTCPVCRETVRDEEDGWVVSDAPGDEEVAAAIGHAFRRIGGL